MAPRFMFTLLLSACVLVMGASLSFAQMSSTNYRIDWDSVGFGGDDTSNSGSYRLRDTLGDTSLGEGTSATYTLQPGYRQGVFDEVVNFDVLIQDRSSQVAATSFLADRVTVSSTAGFAADDYIIIIENEGGSQVSAMAKVTSVSGSDLVVDFYTNAGSNPTTIDGSSDFVYRLDSSTLDFGQLNNTIVTTATIGWEVSVDADDGYDVYLFEDQNLQNSSGTVIADVTDGAVTAGSNEYGARSSDTSLGSSTFDSQDTAITSSLQQIGSRAADSFSTRDFLTLKASFPPGHSSGSYSHTLTFIYVGDY